MRKQLIEEVRKELEKKVGDSAIVTVATIRKNNGVKLTGVTVRKEEQKLSPTIYIDGWIEKMERGFAFAKEVADYIIETVEANNGCDFGDIGSLFNRDFILNNVEYQIVNAEKNAERLKEIPHKEFLDLAITYIVPIESTNQERGTVLVNDGIMNTYGITLEELDGVAEKNTMRNGFRLQNIRQVLAEIQGIPEEMISGLDLEPMYVLSNTQRIFGAAAMLYTDLYRDLSDEFEGDLYIIPSSIHEVLIIPAKSVDKEYMEDMIRDVNKTEVSDEEFLSDTLYVYRKERDVLEVA